MRHYTQLTQKQRYQIYAFMKAGHNQTEAANILGVHKSTGNRELRRNRALSPQTGATADDCQINSYYYSNTIAKQCGGTVSDGDSALQTIFSITTA